MKYELAKQLKDAGFVTTHLQEAYRDVKSPHSDVPLPTLEELIEACGEKFALHKNKDHWKAWQINSNPREPNAANFEEVGSTPTEAVAKLWLALQA